jgi:hypothetical protein
MRWSIEELFKDMQMVSNKGYGFFYKIIHLPESLFRKIRCLFHWIFTGHGYSTYWWLDHYFTKTVVLKLKNYRSKRKHSFGYPGFDEANSEDDWYRVIDEIIEGFECYLLLSTGADNPNVKFDYKIPAFSGEKWDIWFKAQNDWEDGLHIKWIKAKELFFKFYSNFWD